MIDREYLAESFAERFSRAHTDIFAAPGRIELIGNHTDHQNGCVVAAAVNVEVAAAVSKNSDGVIRVFSEGYQYDMVALSELSVHGDERNTSASLIRGTAARFSELGYNIGGFDAYCVSEVKNGGGMSSSAAFEVLLGTVMSCLFNDGSLSPVQIAKIGKYAENVYFGKPCGLMDQLTSAVGGCVFMDFSDENEPEIRTLAFDPAAEGFRIFVVDSGASHEGLTEDYAAITDDMKRVSAYFGKKVLSEVPYDAFIRACCDIGEKCGESAVLRAMHFYGEQRRVREFAECAGSCGFESRLELMNESSASSAFLLKNVIPAAGNRTYVRAIASCRDIAGGGSAVRVHGGGFAGTVLALVPEENADAFSEKAERIFGRGSCMAVRIAGRGGRRVEEQHG